MNMSIDDRLDGESEAWKPKPGDKLVGTVLEVSTRQSEFSGEYPLVTIETGDGREVEWHAFHSVAKSQLARVDPRPGDELGVKFLGLKKPESGNSEYNDYKVVSEPAEPAPKSEPKPTPNVAKLRGPDDRGEQF